MQESFMRRAVALSLENVRDGKGGPFAALIVSNDRIIAEGVNLVTATNDPTAHGEIMAIRAACRAEGRFHLDGCEMYATCEPCPMCLGAIYWARLDKVFFAGTRRDAAEAGFGDEWIYAELVKPLWRRRIPMVQFMREEAVAAFREWRGKDDRIEY